MICSSSRVRPTIGVSRCRSSGAASASTASMFHAPSRSEPVTAWRTSCHVRGPASTWPAPARSRRLVASSTGVPDTSGLAGHHLAGGEPDPRRAPQRRLRRERPEAHRRRARPGRRTRRAGARCRGSARSAVGLEHALRARASLARTECVALLDRRRDRRRDIGGEDGHGLALVIAWRARGRGLRAGRRVEGRVAPQNGALQLLELAARLCPELFDEGPPSAGM